MRAALGDANIAAVWTRDGARLSTAGTVAAIDDARCITTAGRLLVPQTTGSYADLGNRATTLDSLTKLSVLARFTPQQIGAAAIICGRATATADATSPFQIFVSAAGLLSVTLWSGSVANTYTLAGALTAGTEYWIAVVFDGTNGTVANRLMLGIATVANGTAPGSITLTASGGATAPASLGATTTNLTVGANTAGTLQLQSPIDTLALYVASALSQAQVNTEIAASCSGAHHRYTFDGNLNDSGTTGGWGGSVVGTGLAYCSDDTRWGPILMGGGGAANPTWDATNREVLHDAVAQYMRAVGGPLANIAADLGATIVGTLATPQAANARMIEAGDAAAGGNSMLIAQVSTAGNVQATGPGGVTATLSPAAYTSYPGTRALFARTHNAGGGNALAGGGVGMNAEVTASAVGTLAAIKTLVVGAGRTTGNWANLKLRGLMLFNGDFSGQQARAYAWAQSLGATL